MLNGWIWFSVGLASLIVKLSGIKTMQALTIDLSLITNEWSFSILNLFNFEVELEMSFESNNCLAGKVNCQGQ